MTTVEWAAQEKVFIIFNSSLAEAHGTRALKIMCKCMTTVEWAAQEKVFIIFNSSLAEAHGTRTLKIMCKCMFSKVTKLYS